MTGQETNPGRPRLAACLISASAILALVSPPADALAGAPAARPATRSERAAILRSLSANDGTSSGVKGVYISRSDSALAVVCQRTPEAGNRAYVFGRTRGSWRYLTSGTPGRAGTSADRLLERACG